MMLLSDLLAYLKRNLQSDSSGKRVSVGRKSLHLEDTLEQRQVLTIDLKSVLFAPQMAEQINSTTQVEEYVVSFEKAQTNEGLKVLLGAESVTASPHLANTYIVKFSGPVNVISTAEKMSEIPDFSFVHPELPQTFVRLAAPNDALFADQWHLVNTGQGGGLAGVDANIVNAWDSYTGQGVTIAIVDDSVELTHEDLAPNVGPANWHFDYLDGDADPSPVSSNDNHGTSVAGVAAGKGNNSIGISGSAPNAQIAGVRLIGGPLTDSQLANAAAHLTQIVDISNNSWGTRAFISSLGPQQDAAFRNGVLTGRNGLGVVYLFAAGNSRQAEDNVNYHGEQKSRYTITVGAIGNSGLIAPYSTPGAKILVSAPSNGGSLGITTADRTGDNGYNANGTNDGDALANTNYTSTFGGTSSATPLVSGVVALMLEANPNLTWLEVQDILVQTSRRVNPNSSSWFVNGAGHHVSNDYGFGMVDALAAVNMAKTYTKMRPEISASLSISGSSVAIPDGSLNGVTQTVSFNGSLKVTSAELTFNSAHARRGDLQVTLVSPSGTRSILAESRTRDFGANYNNWTFTSVQFWDELAAGDWKVEVQDLRSGITGTLDSFTLKLYGTDPDIPVPSQPRIVSPIAGPTANVTPTYEWTSSSNASSYEIEVTRSGGIVVFSGSGITETSVVQPAQLAEGSYSVRVRAVNSENEFSPWSDSVAFDVDVPAPVQPTLTRPSGEIATSFPTFLWQGSDNAALYTLLVQNLDTNERAIFRTNYQATAYQHFEPLRDGNYRAQVIAYNSVGESSPWSDPLDFRVDAPTPTAPQIVAPATTTNNIDPVVRWNYANEAWKYDLWIDYRNANRSQYVRDQNIIGTTSYQLTNLPQGTYNAWVRAINGNNEVGPWSTVYSFTVDVLPPSKPAMTGPTAGSTVTTLTPTFTWSTAQRAVTYDLWVNNETTRQVQIIRQTAVAGTSFTPSVNLPEGRYTAWVRGTNSAGEVGPWSDGLSFRLDQPAPAMPVFTGPQFNAAGTVESATPTFTWTGDSNAVYYEFQIDDLTGKVPKLIYVPRLTNNSYSVPENLRLNEWTYRAWVRAFNGAGEASPWSAEFRFRIDVPNPSTPQIIGPGGTLKTRVPTFEWVHNNGSVKYEILVRDLDRQENIVLNVTSFTINPTGTVASYALPANLALKNGTYRFWIRAFNSTGTASAWSASRTFAISVTMNSLPEPDDQNLAEQTASPILVSSRRRSESDGNMAEKVSAETTAQAEKSAAGVNTVASSSEATTEIAGQQHNHDETIAQVMEMFANPAADFTAQDILLAGRERQPEKNLLKSL